METFQQVVDILFKVVSFGGWVIGGIALFKSRKKLHKVEEVKDKTVEEMAANQKEQQKKEEEIKEMAKFLCDKCGAETAVKDGQHVIIDDKEFDVCAACALDIEAHAAAINEAREAVSAAEKSLADARERLEKLTQNSGSDILSKLGL